MSRYFRSAWKNEGGEERVVGDVRVDLQSSTSSVTSAALVSAGTCLKSADMDLLRAERHSGSVKGATRPRLEQNGRLRQSLFNRSILPECSFTFRAVRCKHYLFFVSLLGVTMARIEDEIGKIADPVLRTALFDEVKKLKTEKRFGLVFEEHLPELVPVYEARVKARSLVASRGRTFTETFKVVRVHEGMAEVEKNDGSRESILVDELTVVRRFGEPIYPALRPFDRVRNGDTSQPHHILIEADNYHALQLLEYCYSGKVDCIYIDPPYNTGAKDWKYNNDYVDGNDTWRHSK